MLSPSSGEVLVPYDVTMARVSTRDLVMKQEVGDSGQVPDFLNSQLSQK